jgi:hypothetical protein
MDIIKKRREKGLKTDRLMAPTWCFCSVFLIPCTVSSPCRFPILFTFYATKTSSIPDPKRGLATPIETDIHKQFKHRLKLKLNRILPLLWWNNGSSPSCPVYLSILMQPTELIPYQRPRNSNITTRHRYQALPHTSKPSICLVDL